MLDKDAIKELSKAQAISAAAEALNKESNIGVVALPSEFTVHDLEKFMPERRRMRGTMTTSSIKDFSIFTKKNSEAGAAVFIDPENMKATAVLNLGTPDLPGHSDNVSVLDPKKTAAYSILRLITSGKPLNQTDVAEFLEDWIDSIKCLHEDADVPVNKAISAVRSITIEAMRKLESNEKQLSASRSAFESVTATSIETLPTMIYFTCQPYADLQEREFVMRLGILTGSDKPTITLRIIKIEKHEEEMATELSSLIEESIGDSETLVMLGKYASK